MTGRVFVPRFARWVAGAGAWDGAPCTAQTHTGSTIALRMPPNVKRCYNAMALDEARTVFHLTTSA